MIKSIVAVVVIGFAMSVPTMSFAGPNGEAHKAANCSENIAKQEANGNTGTKNGNPKDSKQASEAVTNCDGFWN